MVPGRENILSHKSVYIIQTLNNRIMEFVTNEKLTIVGAAGMIGSNMAQTAIMMGLTPNICLYDPYAPGLEERIRKSSLIFSKS